MDDVRVLRALRAILALAAAWIFAILALVLHVTEGKWAAFAAALLCAAVAVPTSVPPRERPVEPGVPADCPKCGKPTLRSFLVQHLMTAHGYSREDAEILARE